MSGLILTLLGALGPAAAVLQIPDIRLLNLPDPRVVIVGPTGAGKSSVANALLGCDPRTPDCMFPVCGGLESCTKDTTIGTGRWLGTGQNFTVVDTPGFGDSAGEDNELIEEMMGVLDGDLGYSNTILLLFDGQTARFSSGLHNMLRQMSALFGEAWWDFMIIGVSKWSYSQAEIEKRQEDCDYYGDPSENCKNEAWFMKEINGQLQDKFHLTNNFTFAFIDSYSQSGASLDDQLQQDHYQEETKILWDSATTRNSTFDFMTIDDVLEENQFLKGEIKRLEDIIESNITTLFNLVQENTETIDSNQEEIQAHLETVVSNHSEDIGELKTKDQELTTSIATITTTTTTHSEDIGELKTKDQELTTDIATITTTTTTHSEDIEELKEKDQELTTDIQEIITAPIGTIIAWTHKPNFNSDQVETLPQGWVECDGTGIPEGVWKGQKTPNINSEERFLRGSHKENALKTEGDQVQAHTHSYTDYTYRHIPSGYTTETDWTGTCQSCNSDYWGFKTKTTTGGPAADNETRPKNVRVVYIMKIK